MKICWIPSEDQNALFLSKNDLQRFKIYNERITLHFGAWHKEVKVKFHEGLDNTIYLPNGLTTSFSIPSTLSYDVFIDGDNLHIGPVIAFIVKKGHSSQEKINRWLPYCQNYNMIKGLIYFCSVEGIDTASRTIKGTYFDPNGNKEDQWKQGKFPLPGAVYRRTRMGHKMLNELMEHTGGRVFNALIFNKWDMWESFREVGFVHSPYTAMLKDVRSLEKMLCFYSSVYLKPMRGSFGMGIQKIEKLPSGFLFKEKNRNKIMVSNLDEAFMLFKKHKGRGKYIIQEAVPFEFEEKPLDFRAILQKDGSQKWICSGIIAKVGLKGSINTNDISSIWLAREALQIIMGLSSSEALDKEQEIIRICTEACLHIEKAYGLFGDVGIDVVVDRNLNIWVLEINKLHQHAIAMYQKEDPDMYNRVVSKPLEYAKALTGFI